MRRVVAVSSLLWAKSKNTRTPPRQDKDNEPLEPMDIIPADSSTFFSSLPLMTDEQQRHYHRYVEDNRLIFLSLFVRFLRTEMPSG